MKNIPFFTTQYGVASLTLQEIAYKGEAYIRIQASQDPICLLKECADFCHAAGADKIYVTGNAVFEAFALYTRIITMGCDRELLPDTDAVLCPVTKDTMEKWRSIYNEKMKDVPCSSTITLNESQRILENGSAYYVLQNCQIIGIGKVYEDKIEAIAACIPGAGKDVLLALKETITGNKVTVEVSDRNMKAVKLYQSMGFIESGEVVKWYCYK